jgi:hypothetical protein
VTINGHVTVCITEQQFIIIIIIIITMARQPYMGFGLLSEVTWSCAFVAVGDQPTGEQQFNEMPKLQEGFCREQHKVPCYPGG